MNRNNDLNRNNSDIKPAPGKATPLLGAANKFSDTSTLSPRFGEAIVELPEGFIASLGDACSVVDTDLQTRASAGIDWWPLGAMWMLDEDEAARRLPSLPGVVARPSSAQEVADVLRLCTERHVPITPIAGRSGVSGAALSLYGGVALDLCGLSGIVEVDDISGIVEVRAGTFGAAFETELRSSYDLTLGHWPQSMTISTVGGWLACRSAGQFSTRYGKIEDMVVGLEVALANGSLIHTGGWPRAAVGTDLTQLFVGSEGTLGVITSAQLVCHPLPSHEARGAYGFVNFAAGIEACRKILRRGATPAVLRLYDPLESARNYKTDNQAVLLVLDEGDPAIVEATMSIVEQECEQGQRLDTELVEQWMGHRNDVSALESLLNKGWVVDTIEASAPWSVLPDLYRTMIEALESVEGMRAASAHLSHSYLDGACIYATFAALPQTSSMAERERCYIESWNAATRAIQNAGAALSHHHGIGRNRHRFMAESLGTGGLAVLNEIKAALDPSGVLNPGKLGGVSRFGELNWHKENTES